MERSLLIPVTSFFKGSPAFIRSILRNSRFLLMTLVLSFAAVSGAYAQSISSFSPTNGAIGTMVTVSGSGLSSPSSFSIGGKPALMISNNGTTLVGMVMPGATTGSVSVRSGSGTATATGSFTVTPTQIPAIQAGSKLTSPAVGSNFASQGYGVAISADGTTALVGAPSYNSTGGGFIFKMVNGVWTQTADLLGSGSVGNAFFGGADEGTTVALSADGNTAVLGSNNDNGSQGAIWVFTNNNGTWTQQGAKLVGTANASYAQEAISLAISADGNTIAEGGFEEDGNKGAAWVFTRSNGVWTQQAKLQGSTTFSPSEQGYGVAISADGNTVASCAFGEGAVYMFNRTGTTWAQQGPALPAAGALGAGLSADGNILLAGAYLNDQCVMYTRSNGAWSQSGSLFSPNDGSGTVGFGGVVSLSADGTSAMIGGRIDNNNSGAVWFFTYANGTWTQQGPKFVGSDAAGSYIAQGTSAALTPTGSVGIEGGPGDNNDAGAAWIAIPTPVAPVIQASNISFTRTTPASTHVSCTAGAGQYRAIFIAQGAPTSGPEPVNATGYTANSVFGQGDQVGTSGWYCVYNGNGSSVTISGLTASTQYTVAAIDYNGPAGHQQYATTSGAGNPASVTTLAPTVDATLSNLTTDSGTLDPAFSPLLSSFTVAVPNNITSILVTPTPNVAGATVTVNGGDPSVRVSSLVVGANPVYISVTSSDGSSTWTDTLIVNRAPSSNAGVTSVAISDGTLTPAFSSAVTTYADTVANSTTSIGVTVVSADNTSAIKINGNTATSGVAYTVPLNIGPDTVITSVVAQDGITTMNDTLYVTRREAPGAITSFSPQTGAIGTLVTITGNNLLWPSVSIGGQPATIIRGSANQIVAMVMPNATSGNIAITTPAGTFSGGGTFTVTPTPLPQMQLQSKVSYPNANTYVGFGRAVAVSADGNTAIVGAPGDNTNGDGLIYTRQNGNWTQIGTITGSNPIGGGFFGGPQEGNSVAISADGTTAVIGATNDNNLNGAIWIFTNNNGTWTQQGPKIVGTTNNTQGGEEQGTSLAISADGNTVAEGGEGEDGNTGAVWVFTRKNGVWTQVAKLEGTGASGVSEQGYGLAMSADGKTIASGGIGDNNVTGAVWMFTLQGNTWVQQGNKLSIVSSFGTFGLGLALSADGNILLAGADGDNNSVGTVYAYTRTNGVWTQSGPNFVPSDNAASAGFGNSISVSADGTSAIIGGFVDNSDVGATWFYTNTNGTWTQVGNKVVGANSGGFIEEGQSVSMSANGSTAITGGPGDNSAGSAWIYTPAPPAPPATQASNVTFTITKATSTKISWTGGDGAYEAVFVSQGNTGNPSPNNNTTYAANTAFGSGSQIGNSGWYCVYNNTSKKDPSVCVTGLTTGTTHNVMVMDYNGTAGIEQYITATATGNPATVTPSTNLPTTINSITAASATTTSASSVDYTVTFADAVTGLTASNFSLNTSTGITGAGIGTPSTNDGGVTWTVSVTTGTGQGTLQLQLANADNLSKAISTPLPFAGDTYTIIASPPTTQAGLVTFNNTTTSATTIKWTSGNGSAEAVFVSQGSTGTPSPVANTTYSANTAFGSGDQAGSGWYCVFNGTGSSVNLSGLTPGTAYTAMVVDYNGAPGSEQYLTDVATDNPATITTKLAPQISAMGSVSGLNTVPGTASASTSFNVSGLYLQGPVVITPPAGFEVSVDNASFVSSVILTGNDMGTLVSTPVYVRLAAADGQGTYSGSIVLSSTGVDNVNVPIGTSNVTPSGNDNLAGLVLSNGTLSPSFTQAGLTYTANVANSVGSMTVTPRAADANATIKVDLAPVTSGTASQSISLGVGANPIGITVTAQNGNAKTYTVTVTRAASSNNFLTGLTLSNGTLSPSFTQTGTTYTASVANTVTGMTVTPKLSDLSATVTVNGVGGASGFSSQNLPLNVGANTISVVVTAQDGSTKTYTVTVTRAGSANANLLSLTLSNGTLSPSFSQTGTTYAASVANTVTGMTVTPKVADANATITVNTLPVTSGTASQTLPLMMGLNPISIVVTAQDGTTKTYNLTVTRAGSSNAFLTSLTLSNGTLSPSFTQTGIAYTANVGNTVTGITVTPKAADANATIVVNDTSSVVSGTASKTQPLMVGSNLVTVTVTAQDGSSKTYSVTVIRAGSSNANLAGLTLSNGTLSPSFTQAGITYTASVGNAITGMTVTPRAADANATITVNTNGVTSGTASQTLPLTVGANTISIVVTAQDGSIKTYTLTVTRAGSSNANLLALALSNGTLSPSFSQAGIAYTASVANGIAAMTVTPKVVDANATIAVNTVAVTSGSASQSLPLAVGANQVSIVVTAQNGATKTYTLTVIRSKSSNANIAALVVSSGTLSPAFTQANTTYADTVVSTQATIALKAILADTSARMIINGVPTASNTVSAPVALNVGDNPVNIVVMAQDSSTKTYTVTVTRMLSGNSDLLSMKPSNGTLSPPFSAATTSYTTSLPNAITAITITPKASDATATITVNNQPVTSNTASQSIPLKVGLDTITTVVTAQNGTVKTYTLAVTRAGSGNNNLVSMKPSNGTLSPSFNSGVISYTANIGNAISTMTITPKVSDTTAIITVNGQAVASGAVSPAIPVAVGLDTISTVVTAQDGAIKTYTLIVTRASASGLAVVIPGLKKPGGLPQPGDEVSVHQAVSPNCDGINDVLTIENIQSYPDNNIRIMNRSGELIYEAKGYDNSAKVFDGHGKTGQLLLPGTYFYSLDFKVNGETKHKTGYIVLKY